MSEYFGVIVFFILTGGVVGLFILGASMLGPKKQSAAKSEPFECGETPFSLPIGHVAVKFYLTAILFILFDAELVFIYPWAVAYAGLGLPGLIQMVIFIVILMAGFYYAWDNGALEWN